MENYMKLEFPAKSENESFARAAVAAFAVQLDLNIEELSDIKTAVSEAVTNAIIHGYSDIKGVVSVRCRIVAQELEIEVSDDGCGIEDIEQAMQPLYSGSGNDERSGMGFTVMQTFMDDLQVKSTVGIGTTVTMRKIIEQKQSGYID